MLGEGGLPLDFDSAMVALTQGLAIYLPREAMRPDSPLHNLVNTLRGLSMHELLREQLRQQGRMTGQLEELLGRLARIEGNLDPKLLPGPVAGQPPLLTDGAATRERYLELLVGATEHIRLPFAPEERQRRLPLQQVYVALRANPSSAVERKAAQNRMKRLVRERELLLDVAEEFSHSIQSLHPYSVRLRAYAEMAQREIEAGGALHLAEVVQTHRWMVLLGHPGTGKSTLARWLALQLARACQDGQAEVLVPADHVDPKGDPAQQVALGPARLPVLLPIAEYAAARWGKEGDPKLTLFAFLGWHLGDRETREAWGARFHALIEQALAAGRAMLILDGLDEVTDPDPPTAGGGWRSRR